MSRYEGEVRDIPVGTIGLLTDRAPTELPLGALVYTKNITTTKGTAQKAPGSVKYNTTPLSAGIIALTDWFPVPSKQRLIAVTSDGNIYRDIGDGGFSLGVAIKTGLGLLNPNAVFIHGGQEVALNPKKLFLLTFGSKQIQVLSGDGTTFADIKNPAADWATGSFPKTGVVHLNRLWVFSGQRAYASDTGDYENFTSNFLTQSIFPGEGDEILGAYVYKGRLFAFKGDGFVYFLEDSAIDDTTWFWRKLGSGFGLAAPNAIDEVIDDLYGGNDTGTLTSYAATESFGDIESGDVFRLLEVENYIRGTLSTSGISEMHILYDRDNKILYTTYRSTYKTTNDSFIVLDFNKADRVRPSIWTKGTPQCLAFRRDINNIRRPMYGDASGFVNFMNYEDRIEGDDGSGAGTAYEGVFQTAPTNFGITQNKLFDWAALNIVEESNANVAVDVIIDGRFIETIQFEQTIMGDQVDELLLDTDSTAFVTGQTVPKKIHGMGQNISFRPSNSNLGESFQIASIRVGFRLSGHQAPKFGAGVK